MDRYLKELKIFRLLAGGNVKCVFHGGHGPATAAAANVIKITREIPGRYQSVTRILVRGIRRRCGCCRKFIGNLTDDLDISAELLDKVSEEILKKIVELHRCSEIFWDYVLIDKKIQKRSNVFLFHKYK